MSGSNVFLLPNAPAKAVTPADAAGVEMVTRPPIAHAPRNCFASRKEGRRTFDYGSGVKGAIGPDMRTLDSRCPAEGISPSPSSNMTKRFQTIGWLGEKYMLDIQELTLTKKGRKKPTIFFSSRVEMIELLGLGDCLADEELEAERERRRRKRKEHRDQH
jgi:hypothetical protein